MVSDFMQGRRRGALGGMVVAIMLALCLAEARRRRIIDLQISSLCKTILHDEITGHHHGAGCMAARPIITLKEAADTWAFSEEGFFHRRGQCPSDNGSLTFIRGHRINLN